MWAAAVALALLAVVVHLALHRSLRPARVPESASPETEGLDFREVWIPTVRGRWLFGWFVPAPGEEPAPAVAVLHGWGGNAQMMLPVARPLHDAGFAVLLFDARCHGRSDEDSFASLPRFAEDLGCALDWLSAQPGVDPRRLAVLGHSVGAGAALLVASRRRSVASVVSIAAFRHPEAMMRRWLAAVHVPYLPLGWYVLQYVQLVIGHRFDDIAPEKTVRRVSCPVLLVHGERDATVPVDDARAIFGNRSSDAVQLMVIPGGHDAYDELDQHVAEMIRFLRLAERRRPGAESPEVTEAAR